MSQLMVAPTLFCIEISTPPLLVALRCAGDIDIASVDSLERALKASVQIGAAVIEVAEEAAGSELANRFDELDRNHDGKLSPSELRASAATGSSRQDATGGYRGGPIEQDD